MTESRHGHRRGPLLAWGAFLLACVLLISTRLEFSYDLGLFLPAPNGLDQQVLVTRAGDAPGARYLLMALPPGVDVPVRLGERLRETPAIAAVPGAGSAEGLPPDPAWRWRYLLADTDWSVDGLRAAFQARLAELGLAADPAFEALVRRDPTLASEAALSGLASGLVDGPGTTADGRRVMVVETAAAPFDLEGQRAAIEAVRGVLRERGIDGEQVQLSGAGVFGVGLRDTIHAEAAWRSTLASVALALVLLLAYRRIAPLWLAAIPLLTGLLAGLAAVALFFGTVHGITLAFGFTLLGVAIDYPLHWLSHCRRGSPPRAMDRVWPTLRLGAASTVLAYAALLLSGAQGVAQLGLFSAVGVGVAAACTRWVLPGLAPATPGVTDEVAMDASVSGGLRWKVPLAALVLAVAALLFATLGPGRNAGFWSRDLAALSPVPAEQLALDARLREAAGAPSMRYQLALADSDLQSLLTRQQQLHAVLEQAVAAGRLDGFRDIASLLPPRGEQLRRRATIPTDAELRRRLAQALADFPFTPGAFEGFLADATEARALPPVAPEDFEGTPLQAALEASLLRLPMEAGEQWVALTDLGGGTDPDSLPALMDDTPPGTVLVDYRAASEALVAGYQARTWRVLGAVLLVIAVLLLWRVRPARAAWSLACVAAALLLTAAALRLAVGPLDLYHMFGLLLVAGLGLDYALFLGREEANPTDTRHAVATCVASTVVAFAVLAASSIPALRSLGSVVALGAATSFVIAWSSTRPRSQA